MESYQDEILRVLESEDIRLLDGRYSNGFVNEAALRELIFQGKVETYDNGGLTFVRKQEA